MITERTPSCLFLLCGQGLSASELERWGAELTTALAWPEPGESPATKVSVLSSGVTSKAEHGFLLVQVQGPIPRSFAQWLGEAARQHDFVDVPACDLFVLFLKRDAHEQAPQTMAGSPSPLAAFLAEAEPRYEMLAQTLGLVTEAVRNLEQDHLPRGEAFWQGMTASLAVVKQAVDACLALTNEKHVPCSVPDAICAASTKEGVLLHHLRSRIGEVQLRLTAYQNRSSLAQRYLRQRQGVLETLRDLRRAGQDALKQSRVWRDAIQEYVSSSPVPSVTVAEVPDRRQTGQRAGRTAGAGKRYAANNSRANRGTVLHLVTREEYGDGEDQPDTDRR